jgi:CRISPR-associated protein Cas2
MTLVVVAYDIPHDRRRARVHALLLGYGEPVQESLFECDLDEPRLRALRAALKRQVRPVDKIRLYPLCAECAGRIADAHGPARPASPALYLP